MGYSSNAIKKRERITGFSLIELLMVVAILAVVTAILIPVFAQNREKNRTEACLSHTHQIGSAVLMYLQDNSDRMFVYNRVGKAGEPSVSRTGVQRLSVESASGATWWNVLSPFLKNRSALACPSDDAPTLSPDSSGSRTIPRSYVASRYIEGLKKTQFDDPAETMVVAEKWDKNGDGPVHDGWLEPFNGDLDFDKKGGDRSHNRLYKVGNRHGEKVNSVFLDGHADTLAPEDIQESKDLTGCNLIHDYPVPGVMDVTVASSAGSREPNICTQFLYPK